MSDFTVLACHDGKNSNKAKNITAENFRFICQIKWGVLFVVVVVATFTTGKKHTKKHTITWRDKTSFRIIST